MSKPELRIHYTDTTNIFLDIDSLPVLLLNAGVHPDIPPEQIRLYGYDDELERPDGTKGPGISQPICVWYIETPELKILVDTGVSEENAAHANKVFRTRKQGQLYVKRAEHDIGAFLNARGTAAEEIDLVILTHLHLDHFCNAGYYPNARFLVQRKELPLGLAPPPYAQFHWREFTPYLTAVLDRVDAIDGDAKVCDGVEVWHVGGHSPGQMAVAVDTSVGKVVLASDFFFSYRNIELSWPPGAFSSLEEWEENCRMIKRKADVIVPNHDYEVWVRHPGGTIG